MASFDGERLAPVTWLFGPPRSGDEKPRQEAVSPSAAPPPAPAREDVVRSLAETMEQITAQQPEVRRDREPGRFQRINNVSMHALGRRGMSTAEMRDYLATRDFESDEVEAEVDRLLRVGLLDDFALAETLIRTLRDRKGLGRSALVAELRRRKLDAEAVDAALEDLDDDEFARAIQLAEKRASQLRSLDAETARRRLGAFLMRKGYSGGVVQTAVDRALPRASSGPVFR